ncbi:MAG: type II toxin-antitoxin system VapC family toxin [Blastocatellia bacterium]
MRVYLDSCVIIYLVEEHATFAPLLEGYLQNRSEMALACSALSELECLVMPLRNGNKPLIDKFHSWFAQSESLPIDREVFHRAARLRARHSRLKTPDAIHLAAALHHGCEEFWTNDDRLNVIAPQVVRNVLAP